MPRGKDRTHIDQASVFDQRRIVAYKEADYPSEKSVNMRLPRGADSHITHRSKAHSVCNSSFGVHSYHTMKFVAEGKVRKVSIASFILDWKPQASVP
ncbi:hypothetical protein TNCV_1912191 [Trichonephila clavipes]|nr:hypothetical protein TNCV_1912191 [Trichonephila clavipes]